ncbi:MAG: hypothetical protein FVQ80_08840 [Planctomycetes bacterium]|nr:hypothetical protein [Planctomycetota bacterium]
MKNKKQKIRYGPKKASCNARPAVVLLVVLFVVMAITIFSLGYITSSDTALIAAENVKIRNELDYLAESGLEHARQLLLYPKGVDLQGSDYWTGASGQQLLSGDDYYDVNVSFTDTGGTDSYYTVTSTAYREVSNVRIAESIISAEIPLNMPTEVKYWKLDAGTGTTVTDSSSNGISGWWYGGSFTYMRWNSGLFGSAITFDGGSSDFSWIRGNSADTLTLASASISLWMCMPVTYQADGAVAEFRTSNPDNASYTLEVDNTAKLRLRKTDGGGTLLILPGLRLPH